MRIERFSEVGSTNDVARALVPRGEDTVVIAARQTGGRGTKGRSFLSEAGGLYLSALTFHRGLPAREAFRVMTHAAVAVCRTARAFGVEPSVKWPNDVYADGRKLCGILIENGIADGLIAYSIVGIGINVTNDVSALGGLAVSLSELAPAATLPAAEKAFLAAYGAPSDFAEYRAFVGFLGSPVRIAEGGREYPAVARDVLPDGRLLLDDGRALSDAEVRLILPGRNV